MSLPSTWLWRRAGGIYVCPLRPPDAPASAPRLSPCPVQTPSPPPAGLLPSPCCHMGAVFPARRADSSPGSCGGEGHEGRTQGPHSPSPARSHCSHRLGEAAGSHGLVGGGLFSGTSAYKHIFNVNVGPALENTPAKGQAPLFTDSIQFQRAKGPT